MTAARAKRRTASLAGLSLLAAGAMTLSAACSSSTKQDPALEVVVYTDLRYPQDYDAVEIKVSQLGPNGVLGSSLFDEAEQVALPKSVAVYPGTSSNQVARIVATAFKGVKAVVSSTAQTQVPASSVQELDMFLYADCEGVSCSVDETCAAGACTTFVVPPSQLKPYDPGDLDATPDVTLGSPADAGGGGGDAGGVDADASKAETSAPPPADAATDAKTDAGSAEASIPDAGHEAAAPCGATGQACCPYNSCSQGCCDLGMCIGQGQTCPASGGMCDNGGCQNDICGTPGMACCPAGGGDACNAPFTACSTSVLCVQCGNPNAACCPGNVCHAGFVCARPADGGAFSCLGCGMSHQLCCPLDTGVSGAPTQACANGDPCGEPQSQCP